MTIVLIVLSFLVYSFLLAEKAYVKGYQHAFEDMNKTMKAFGSSMKVRKTLKDEE